MTRRSSSSRSRDATGNIEPAYRRDGCNPPNPIQAYSRAMPRVWKRFRGPIWQTGLRDPAEILAVATLIVMLNLVAVGTYNLPALEMRIATTEALTMATDLRLCTQEEFAVRGILPSPGSCVQRAGSTAAIRSRAGLVEAPVDAPSFAWPIYRPGTTQSAGNIGLRLSAADGASPATFAWRCGYAPDPPGMHALGPNLTTLDERLLPSSCRPKVSHAPSR
jgi:hypothetical protein